MKCIFTLILLNVSLLLSAQSDSTKFVLSDSIKTVQPVPIAHTWHFNGAIQLNNNGISPVPAFSLGKPALMSALFVRKGGFTYSPEFNYGSDGKPWVINNWLRYQWQKGRMAYRAGVNLSMFFGRETIQQNNKSVINAKLNQYGVLEGGIGYQVSEKTSINLMYWNSYGLDEGSVKTGHFISLSATITKIALSKTLQLQLRPNVFYINNSVPFEGFFVSGIASISYKKFPFLPFIQGVQPIWAKPSSKPNWNYGVNYIF
jgi:hypothetical protein